MAKKKNSYEFATRADMKARAKEVLAGKWNTLAGITVVYMLIVSVASGISTQVPLISIIGSLATIVLAVGLIVVHKNVVEGEDPQVVDLFEPFKDFGFAVKIVLTNFLVGLIVCLAGVLAFVGIGMMVGAGVATILGGGPELAFTGIALAGMLLMFVGIIPIIIVALGLSQVNYVLLDNPDIGMMDALKRSFELMKGHKMELFVLGLSFLGWIFLAMFTLCIGFFWLIPYIQTNLYLFYKKIENAA